MEENNFRQIKMPINSHLIVVQSEDYKWGAIDDDGNVIVPFGKYAWIDGFQNGLAKVIGYNDTTSPNIVAVIGDDDYDHAKCEEQGIINENGEEVLSLEYTGWKFYGKDFPTIKTFKDGNERLYSFGELNPDFEDNSTDNHYNNYSLYDDDPDYCGWEDTWDAMTDGQYGDVPECFDGDYSFMGY